MVDENKVGNFTVEVYEGISVIKVKQAKVTVIRLGKITKNKKEKFLSDTGILGIAKFKDIPLDDYKVIVEKEEYDDSITIRKKVIVPGKDKTGHFVKPNNLLKINLYRSPYLFFDGSQLYWIEKNKKIASWSAVSGRNGYQASANQKLKGKGPLPEGKWLVKQSEYQKMPERSWVDKVAAELGRTAWPGGESSWGKNRVWIYPVAKTDVYGRSGFSIHGGDTPGSAGCIDLTSHMPEFIKKYLAQPGDMLLEVNYEKKSTTNTQ